MRILFATNHAFLPQRVGGSETVTHDLAMQLGKLGHTCAVLANIAPGDLTWARNRAIARLTGRRFPPDTLRPYRIYRGYGVEEGVREVAADFRPDVVIVQAGRQIPLVRRCLELGIRTAFYVHDVEFDKFGGEVPCHENLVLIANSAFTAARLHAFCGIEATVIPPLVRGEAYATTPSKEYALFINPVPMKGVEIALALAAAHPDIPFLFLEGWPQPKDEKAALLKRIAALPNIRYRRSTTDMRRIYRMARVVLVPSQCEEAWGRVVSEAHFSGIPVLASRIGGLPESVGPGGLMVEPRDSVEVWGGSLRRIWHDDATHRRLAEAARQFAKRPEIEPDYLADRLLQALRGR